jgi:hypothetical protein
MKLLQHVMVILHTEPSMIEHRLSLFLMTLVVIAITPKTNTAILSKIHYYLPVISRVQNVLR